MAPRQLAMGFLLLLVPLAGCAGGDAPPAAGFEVRDLHDDSLGRVVGRVTDDELAPIPGALVAVLDGGRSANTSDDGSFILGGLTPGEHRIAVQALGYNSVARTVTVAPGEDTEAVFQLPRLAIITPYAEIIILRGYSICDLNAIYVSFTLAAPGCEAKSTVFLPRVNATWKYAVVEAKWRTSEAMNLVSDLDNLCNLDNSNPCFKWLIRRSPARFDAAPGDANFTRVPTYLYPSTDFTWRVSIFSAGMFQSEIAGSAACLRVGEPPCAGVGFSLGTAFDAFISIFHHARPEDPAAFTAMPDG